jgi:hypothetical protein
LSVRAAAGELANEASPNLALLRRDVLLSEPSALRSRRLHGQDARVLHSAERATKSAAPSAGNAAAGYKPAGRTGQRPVFRI